MKKKKVCDLDDFNKDALRWKMLKMYDTSIYPTVKKLVKEMEKSFDFGGSSLSIQDIKGHNRILTNLTLVADYNY